MAKQETTKLPKTLFVSRENPGTDDEFFSVNEVLEDIVVETGKRQLVGEYVLQRKVELVTETRIVAEVG
jgi:hypothetical protein